MKREGHFGTTLLLGALAVVGLGMLKGLVATVVMIVVTPIPDQDQYVPGSLVKHRGPTHSFTFVLVIAFVISSTIAYSTSISQQFAISYGPLSTLLVSPEKVWLFLGGSVTVSLLGHIATDVLTKGGGYKVKPFWPLSSWTVALGLCKSDDVRWNTALLASGGTAFLAAVLHELYYSVLPAVL